MNNLILFNKPFGVLSQFSGGSPNLSDFIDVPEFYVAGRLDKDSEGLLLLTNDGRLQARISQPRFKMAKTYWVQLEGEITNQALTALSRGVELKDGLTKPATAARIEPPLPARAPDIRYRASVPTSWIELTLFEGRNRQVRRMTASVGFPTLRLYRSQIGPWRVTDLAPGQLRFEKVNL